MTALKALEGCGTRLITMLLEGTKESNILLTKGTLIRPPGKFMILYTKQAKKKSKWADLGPYRFKVIPCIVLGAVGYSDQSEQELQTVLIG